MDTQNISEPLDRTELYEKIVFYTQLKYPELVLTKDEWIEKSGRLLKKKLLGETANERIYSKTELKSRLQTIVDNDAETLVDKLDGVSFELPFNRSLDIREMPYNNDRYKVAIKNTQYNY